MTDLAFRTPQGMKTTFRYYQKYNKLEKAFPKVLETLKVDVEKTGQQKTPSAWMPDPCRNNVCKMKKTVACNLAINGLFAELAAGSDRQKAASVAMKEICKKLVEKHKDSGPDTALDLYVHEYFRRTLVEASGTGTVEKQNTEKQIAPSSSAKE